MPKVILMDETERNYLFKCGHNKQLQINPKEALFFFMWLKLKIFGRNV